MEAPDMGVGAEIALNLWGSIGDYALLETGPLLGPKVAVTLSDLCHRRWGVLPGGGRWCERTYYKPNLKRKLGYGMCVRVGICVHVRCMYTMCTHMHIYVYVHVHRLACTHITYLFAMYIRTSFLVQFWGSFCLRTLSIVVIFP